MKGEIQDWRDSGLEWYRKGEFIIGGIWYSRKAGNEGYWNEGMQERREEGKKR